jgi:uncharacterized protein
MAKTPAKPAKSSKSTAKEPVVEVMEKKKAPKSKNDSPESADEKVIASIEKKLKALYDLQTIDSLIDKIRIVRGELPLEVQDLEDEIAGIQTRIENSSAETTQIEESILEKKNAIKNCQVLIKKYEAQQMNVRNNREYDSLSKEIEYQNLEIQLCEKRIKEFKVSLDLKKEVIEKSNEVLEEKIKDLEVKKAELNDIIAETEKEETLLLQKSAENQQIIEDRLLNAYQKIRKNARNGLAVVVVERDACGGCFNKIPPQRQLDIRLHKKIIVCEYCGRILVDDDITGKI